MAKDIDKQWIEWAEKVKAKRAAFDQALTDAEKELLAKVAKMTGQDGWFSIDSDGRFFDKDRGCNDTFYFATELLANGMTTSAYASLTQEEEVMYNDLINKL